MTRGVVKEEQALGHSFCDPLKNIDRVIHLGKQVAGRKPAVPGLPRLEENAGLAEMGLKKKREHETKSLGIGRRTCYHRGDGPSPWSENLRPLWTGHPPLVLGLCSTLRDPN